MTLDGARGSSGDRHPELCAIHENTSAIIMISKVHNTNICHAILSTLLPLLIRTKFWSIAVRGRCVGRGFIKLISPHEVKIIG